MNRLALMTGVLTLTLAGVAAEAQTQPGSQPKFYQQQPQYQGQPHQGQYQGQPQHQGQSTYYRQQPQAGMQGQTVPGSAYQATQQREMTQPGAQPKLYQHQDQPTAVTTAPAPASGMGAIGTMTGTTQPYQGGAAQAYQGHPVQAQPGQGQQFQPNQGQPYGQPGFAATGPMSGRDLTVEIQQELTTAGYEPGPIDGIAGPRTKKAIREYQAANGMPQDGAPSAALLNQMRGQRMQSVAPAAGQPQFQPPPQPQSQAPFQAPSGAQQQQSSATTSGTTTSSGSSGQQESESGFMGGLFSGWFKRMDDESQVGKEVASGYQPKFYRENTTSQESHGPGITYPWPEEPAAMNRVAPAAGKPQ